MALRRIQKDLQEITRDPPEGVGAGPEGNDMFHWTGTILGPPDTPYEAGIFYLDIVFPPDYPFSKPKILFKTRIYHPNITPKGQICINLLCCEWEASLTIAKVLRAIRSLMADPDTSGSHYPHFDIPKIYRTDRATFDRTAREWTERYAT